MILNKNIISVILVLFLFVITWVIVLQLTQQRILLESENKIQSINNNQTPFVWNFDDFESDIVTPYQKYWEIRLKPNSIYAQKNTNPILSLNFSSDILNAKHFDQIHIESSSKLNGNLKLQIKVSHEEDVFYYSDSIKLSGSNQLLNLNREWFVIEKGKKLATGFRWPGIKSKISSVVFQFSNPINDLFISKISIPFNNENRLIKRFGVNCLGHIDLQAQINQINHSVFVLNDSCWLPSNYMWLKSSLENKFPGSILTIGNKNLMMKSSIHKVNKNYGNNYSISAYFYVVLVLFIVAIFILTSYNKSSSENSKLEINNDWRIASANILGISLLIIIIMSLYKSPNIQTYKLFPMYFIWAIFQQFVLGFILAEKIFYKKTQNKFISSFLATTVFAVLHLPSMTLVILTFIGGFLWSYAWLTFKRIIPLAISHSLLALTVYYVVSNKILYSARVFHWFWE